MRSEGSVLRPHARAGGHFVAPLAMYSSECCACACRSPQTPRPLIHVAYHVQHTIGAGSSGERFHRRGITLVALISITPRRIPVITPGIDAPSRASCLNGEQYTIP
jgi:hypothetical protein